MVGTTHSVSRAMQGYVSYPLLLLSRLTKGHVGAVFGVAKADMVYCVAL